MSEIQDNMQYIWIVQLISGVLALTGLITPAASFSYPPYVSTQIWMWGLISVKAYDFFQGYVIVTQFTEDPVELTICIIATLIVVIGAVGLFSSANKARKLGYSKLKGVTPSILLIIGTLFWIIEFEVLNLVSSGVSFWDAMSPGFAVLAPFLGAVISLIGYGATKTISKSPREPITPIKKTTEKTQAEVYNQRSFKFCPSCGEKIAEINQRYCVNCGYDLKNYPGET